MSFKPIPVELEEIANAIVDSAYKIHKELGPGLLEIVYEICFCYELEKRGYVVKRQVPVPINYDGIKFDEALRLDVMVNDTVAVELKSIGQLKPIHTAQMLTYLKLTDLRLGFLINFNVPIIKNGIKRLVR